MGLSPRPRIKLQRGKSLRPKATPLVLLQRFGCTAAESNSFGFAATFRLRCGRRQLPQALRRQLPHEGAWGSYCQCSALRQENFGRKKLPDYMDLVVTGSLARELPKAEGVARGRTGLSTTAKPSTFRVQSRPLRNSQKKYLLSLIYYLSENAKIHFGIFTSNSPPSPRRSTPSADPHSAQPRTAPCIGGKTRSSR